jgi:4-alpha-glucanotransferase
MEPILPQFIRFGRALCNDLEAAERREWWLANGLGGYAAGTVAGTLTRRYHGLLIAPLSPPLGRVLVLAKADATLVVDGQSHPLHSNRWTGGAIDPRGYLHLEAFHLDGRLPVWRYAFGDRRLEARVWMEAGANTTYLAWRLLTPCEEEDAPRLLVRLLINARDHHGQTAAGDLAPAIEAGEGELRVALEEGALLRFRSRCGQFRPERTWIERFDLPAERERGLPDRDDHLCIGTLELPLYSGEWVGGVASLEEDPSPYLGEALRERRLHDASLLRTTRAGASSSANPPPWIDQLVLAADSFLVQRPLEDGTRGRSVIAGYPWFGDWGRDTFIALPGLTLATGRHAEARAILESWIGYLDHGLLPNHFPERGTPPAYNAADAALWYVEAWRAFLAASPDRDGLRRHFPALASILTAYADGTGVGIARDPADGLLRAGRAQTQLTWMDACVEGRPVTPRAGKPVELNALWYNALMSLAALAPLIGAEPEPWSTLAAQAREGFRRFIRADGAGLYDVLDGPQGGDARVRPNQILAVSLAYSPLDAADQAAVVRTVGTRLATSYGLRTLSPDDPAYQPHYALAVHRVRGDAAAAQSLLDPFADHLTDAGLGSISELFDAEPPHAPRGAPAQAWSVACTLDAWCRLEQAKGAANGSSRGQPLDGATTAAHRSH